MQAALPIGLPGLVVAVAVMASGAMADTFAPLRLAAGDDESVYAKPMPPSESELYNQGGVNLDLRVGYLTDHVFRGIDRSDVGGPEDAPNLQFDGLITFNLGNRIPHPFVGAFVNVYDADPVSEFQEIRPTLGIEWTLRPFIFAGGHNSYIYLNRDSLNTGEVWVKATLMDGELFRTPNAEPILSPYVLAAYDYELYNGWYIEAGVTHDFPIEGTGLTLSVGGSVAYVHGVELFSLRPGGKDNGFQRYQIDAVGRLHLNQLLNISRRYGQWWLAGYLSYTDNIDDELRADRQIWGGMGIEFRY